MKKVQPFIAYQLVYSTFIVFAMMIVGAGTSHAQTTPAASSAEPCYQWIDAATGKAVPRGPVGWSPTGLGGIPGENPDPNHVEHGGHTFVKLPDGSWIDAATGKAVPTGPVGWSPTGLGGIPGENPYPNHVEHGGRTFVRVPCPSPGSSTTNPPANASNATPVPAPNRTSALYGYHLSGGVTLGAIGTTAKYDDGFKVEDIGALISASSDIEF